MRLAIVDVHVVEVERYRVPTATTEWADRTLMVVRMPWALVHVYNVRDVHPMWGAPKNTDEFLSHMASNEVIEASMTSCEVIEASMTSCDFLTGEGPAVKYREAKGGSQPRRQY